MSSVSVKKPCAKPRGTYIISRFSVVSSAPNHWPKVGESGAQIDDHVVERALDARTTFTSAAGGSW